MKIVVSGTGSGLGLAIGKEILNRSGELIALHRGAPSPELAALKELYPERVQLVKMDLLDEKSVMAGLDEICRTNDSVDGIINCAGIFIGRDDTIETVSLEDFRETMEVNVYAPVLIIQRLLPLLRRGTAPGIVNVSSSAACIEGTRDTDYSYSVSKVSLNMITEKVRKHLIKDGIRCLAVHPGWMNTRGGGGSGAPAPATAEGSAKAIVSMLLGEISADAVPAFVDRFGKPVRKRNAVET